MSRVESGVGSKGKVREEETRGPSNGGEGGGNNTPPTAGTKKTQRESSRYMYREREFDIYINIYRKRER